MVSSNGKTPLVEFHGDDYGLFPAQSSRILDCHDDGCLNGVSVMATSPYLPETMERLKSCGDVAAAVHLNLVEGRCVSAPETVPLLADENGVFRCSFLALLVKPRFARAKYQEQIKRELRAQIDMARRYLGPDRPLRLDSHCHFHMLPVVFDSMAEIIRETGWPVEYIRVPRERCSLYLRHRKELEGFRPINLVKAAVLNVLSWRDMRRHRALMEKLEQRLFMGVMLSGHMSGKNVKALLPDAAALAKKLGVGLEVLAHPGAVLEPEDTAALTAPDDVAFMTSPLRQTEAEMFRALRTEAERYNME